MPIVQVQASELKAGDVVKISGDVELSGGTTGSIAEGWFTVDRVGCAGNIRVVFTDDGIVMCKMFSTSELVDTLVQ